jgi:hypothetical protein
MYTKGFLVKIIFHVWLLIAGTSCLAQTQKHKQVSDRSTPASPGTITGEK